MPAEKPVKMSVLLALLRAEIEQAAKVAQGGDDGELPDLRFAEVKIDFSYVVHSADRRGGVQVFITPEKFKGMNSNQVSRMTFRLKDADLMELEAEGGQGREGND